MHPGQVGSANSSCASTTSRPHVEQQRKSPFCLLQLVQTEACELSDNHAIHFALCLGSSTYVQSHLLHQSLQVCTCSQLVLHLLRQQRITAEDFHTVQTPLGRGSKGRGGVGKRGEGREGEGRGGEERGGEGHCHGSHYMLTVQACSVIRTKSIIYSETCLRWSLCKAATSLKQPLSLVPDSTRALESTSPERPPLYNGQLELAHRRLS